MKPLFVEESTPLRSIQAVSFGLASTHQQLRASHAQLINSDLYKLNRPVLGGPLDTRLGVGNKTQTCQTCFKKIDRCPGHFGVLQLALPIYHPLLFKQALNCLKTVCKNCSSMLLGEQMRVSFLKKMQRSWKDYQSRQTCFKKILVQSKKNEVCRHCGMTNPKVLKASKLAVRIELVFEKTQKKTKKVQKMDLSPLQAYHILNKVDPLDWPLLNMQTSPADLLLWSLPVPPVCIRPSLMLTNSTSNEDDLTMRLRQIFIFNKRVQSHLNQGEDYTKLDKDWYLLNAFVAHYMNSDMTGLPMNELGKKSIRSLCVRLKGKQGRFRQNLSGKRSNFTGRTVISPDPNLKLNEVIVPEFMSKILTISEQVTRLNLGQLEKAVSAGSSAIGGANFVIQRDGTKLMAQFVKKLVVGDVVQRHIRDGDIVIFNRQPSLHRISMMGFKVKVRAGKTLRFNECVCAPFNADFDGDQMNIHVPQTIEAQAQTKFLMGLQQNIMSPKNGQPIVALIQDFITCSFLLSQKDRFLTKQQLYFCLTALSDGEQHFEVPLPAILKPEALWTGKQVLSALLRPNKLSRIVVNFSLKQKRYDSGEVMCPRDGFVLFKNSEHLAGQIGKVTVGGSKKGLLYAIIRDSGLHVTCQVMSRFSKLSGRWMSNYGFTIGLTDVTPAASLKAENDLKIMKALKDCQLLRQDYKQGKIKSEAGKTAEQVLEHLTNHTLSRVRQTVGDNCTKLLHRDNMALVMSVCGAKGSPVNLSQMIGCLGQQTVGGKRISNGFTDRTLPHFKRQDIDPVSKGFVKNSFNSGLTAIQFFFHTMGGREGLIDTAVKTAQTGYMQRRLIKLLQDVAVMYDQTVRSCDRQQLIQIRYGEDGLNPMFTQEETISLQSLQNFVRSIVPARPHEQRLSRKALMEQFSKGRKGLELALSRFDQSVQNKFYNLLDAYIQKKLQIQSDRTFSRQTLTHRQLKLLLNKFGQRASRAVMMPGQTVGAVTAQSIGEPATQMTLKTFHFAGISSMNITQGVPRMNEIINASTSISTPIIEIRLSDESSLTTAQNLLNRIQITQIKQICQQIRQVYSPTECYLDVLFDQALLRKATLSIDQISLAIASFKLGLKRQQIKSLSSHSLRIHAKAQLKNQVYQLRFLKKNIPDVPVKGIKGLKRVLINKSGEKFNLFAEGTGLKQILQEEGVDQVRTSTNHIMQIEEVLGIQAARAAIIKQISSTMRQHGVSIDCRHIYLLSEIMCWRGKVTSFNRYGVDKIKDSTLMLASFEKTADFLFDAAAMGKVDRLRGSSQRIITGQSVSLGTGSFKLLWKE